MTTTETEQLSPPDLSDVPDVTPDPTDPTEVTLAPPKPFYRTIWFYAFVGSILLMTLLRPLLRYVPPPPPTFGQLQTIAGADVRGGTVALLPSDGVIRLVVVRGTPAQQVAGDLPSHVSGTPVGVGIGRLGGVVPGAADRVMRKVWIILQQMREGDGDVHGVYTLGPASVDAVPVQVGLVTVSASGEEKAARVRIAQGDLALPNWNHLSLDPAAHDALMRQWNEVADAIPAALTSRRAGVVGRPDPLASVMLVDGAGQLRGLYAVDGPEVVHELVHRIAHIRQQAAATGRRP